MVTSMGLFGFVLVLCYGGVFAAAEQALHRAKAFSAFHSALLVRGVHGKLGGDTATTLTLPDQGIPDHVRSSSV